MSTRRLILAALLCGLAILVAGGIQLLRISDDEPIRLPALGESRTVDGVQITPVEVTDVGPLTVVRVDYSLTPTAPALGDGGLGTWTLLRGETSEPTDLPDGGDDCRAVTGAEPSGSCRVAFETAGSGARFLAVERGGVEARWSLDA